MSSKLKDHAAASSTNNFKEESADVSVDNESEIEEQETNALLGDDTKTIDNQKPQGIISEMNDDSVSLDIDKNEEPRKELNTNNDASVKNEEAITNSKTMNIEGEEKLTLLYDEDINEAEDETLIDETDVTSSHNNNEEPAANIKAIDTEGQDKNALLEEDAISKNSDVNGDGKSNDDEELDNEASNLLVEEQEENTLLERNTNTTNNQHPPGFFTDQKGNLKVVNLVVRYPCMIFFLILLSTIGISFLLVLIVFKAGNPFAAPGSEYDINDIRSTAYDSFRLVQEEIKQKRDDARRLTELNSTAVEVRVQEDYLDVTYWVYESETQNGVFSSAESISAMKESLDLFTKHKDYQDYCWKLYIDAPLTNLTNGTISQCHPPLSPLQLYYASYWDSDKAQSVIDQLSNPDNIDIYNDLSLCLEYDSYCELVPKEVLTEENEQWFEAVNNNITSIVSKLDGNGELNSDNINQMTLFAAYVMKLDTKRGIFDFFYDKYFSVDNPVSMYSRAMINWGGPLNVTSDNLDDEDRDVLKQYIVDNMLQDMEEISSNNHNPYVNSYYFMGVLIVDVLLETSKKDAMLALFSFGFVFLYIRVAVGSWFLALIGFLEILMSIPVSWFLFTVVFQIKYFSVLNTLCLFIVAAIGADDIFIFMDAYKHSAHQDSSVLESLESRMSWVYRRAGFAMAITSATTCSAFLCTLITPLAGVRAFGIFAAIVIFIDYVLVMSLFCTSVVIYHNKFEKQSCFYPCSNCCKTINLSSTQKAFESAESSPDGQDPENDKISHFFRNKVAGVVLCPRSRAVIALVFFLWLVVAMMYTIQLEPTQETEQFLNEDHPLQKSFSILGNAFAAAEEDDGLMIYFTWGIGDVDRSGVKQLMDPDYLGSSTYLEEFNFDKECQTNMMRACDDLKTSTKYSTYVKQDGGLGSVKCFVEEFGAFSVFGNLDDCEAVKTGSWKNETWQVSLDDIPDMMESFIKLRSCYSSDIISSHYQMEMGWDGTSVRYASLALESSKLDQYSTKSESLVREQYDAMISISSDFDSYMNDSCGPNYMTDTNTKFVFMNNQSIYKKSALQSSMVGLAIAFTILLISTKVLHIAFFATLSILCVLLSVIGTMVMLDWTLGSIESILICILAGFSVDYVVHLAHAYERAPGNTENRIKAAFGEMGISVFNGMFTSVGASVPLFFCQLQFFKKFGTFLCLTIAFSWIFANFAFMSVLAQCKIPIKRDKGCRL